MPEKYPKNLVTTRTGTQVRMNDAALKMAERHFGVTRNRPRSVQIPPEILKMPKIEIIKAEVKVTPPVDAVKVEHDIVIESIKENKRKAPIKSKSTK
jgi:hypothetical protein